ncbi:hypothetical protein HPB47_022794 [Ixodes persulcatus]|uniref:Uncharacterized protein n=1 Tax=Ixodes persulcatus TaxID=34615 RepID=A0AC60Q967_IXOPE|nr:hypothetical protein HPB47_022794 [Ixodes persulcatus]
MSPQRNHRQRRSGRRPAPAPRGPEVPSRKPAAGAGARDRQPGPTGNRGSSRRKESRARGASSRTVATWTSQVGSEAPRVFVSWARWKLQRRPERGQSSEHIPSLFRGQTTEDADRMAAGACLTPADGATYCSDCGGLMITSTTEAQHRASLLHRDRVGGDGGGGHVRDVAFLERPEAVAWVLESFQRDPAFRDAVLAGVLADPDRPDGGTAIPASCPGAPADLPGAAAAAAAAPAAQSSAPADEPGPVVGPSNPGAPSFTFDVAMLL